MSEIRQNVGKGHPEGNVGEVFLGNFTKNGVLRMGLETIRLGKQAYDSLNMKINFQRW